MQVGEVGAAFASRPQLVLQLGTLEQAADVYFEIQEAISKLSTSALADKTHALEAPAADLPTLLAGVAGLPADAVLGSLEAAGLGLAELLRLAGCGDEGLRPRLKACGVKKIGQREQFIAALEDEAKARGL